MKILKWIIVATACCGFIAAVLTYYPKLVIMSGYAAKIVCSCTFIGEMDEETIINKELNFKPLQLITFKIDKNKKTATASVFGLHPKTAVYREGLGCALLTDLKANEAFSSDFTLHEQKHDSLIHWFEKRTVSTTSSLAKAINDAFIENDPNSPTKNTRAVVILHKGQLIGEQYATEVNQDTPLLGWSMTKSLTSTLFGILSDNGDLDINDKTNIPEWQNDSRSEITWKHLLQMNSGLRWKEDYTDLSDAVTMLFNSDAIGQYAKSVPAESKPGTVWNYSSGTSNILSSQMKNYFGSQENYLKFPYDSLFGRLGMYSMRIETDATGDFVGSSYAWATARDWAKIGQLYLQNGVWEGEEIISPEWVSFIQEPANGSDQLYGGHFWINSGGRFSNVPLDAYSMNGFHSQRIMIIPSLDLVIVRLGVTYKRGDFDFNDWYGKIISAVEKDY
ncbi:MAG: serine hydrolase [Reichenbachiella sp.]|uniref:serine hydrolase domain-containing protein n=1 Tax=Reichenbachiella sp. TaxID=2184521 RepID=UPI0029662196|nr:serine hydrolase [Reichenbachiella sp.]MDW3211206.1 serine hydrolase [Reichenbachiella sp.]